MSAVELQGAYGVDDLDLACERFATPHIEIDPWGNLIVTPATDPHEYAINTLRREIERALRATDVDALVYVNGPPWRVPGGTGYINQPDLTVLAAGTRRAGPGDLSWAPPPLLVVEVASPSTRAIDRSRKRADYLLGGARAYWMVDLPTLTPVEQPTVTAVSRSDDGEDERGPLTGRIALEHPFPATIDLGALVLSGRWA